MLVVTKLYINGSKSSQDKQQHESFVHKLYSADIKPYPPGPKEQDWPNTVNIPQREQWVNKMFMILKGLVAEIQLAMASYFFPPLEPAILTQSHALSLVIMRHCADLAASCDSTTTLGPKQQSGSPQVHFTTEQYTSLLIQWLLIITIDFFFFRAVSLEYFKMKTGWNILLRCL